MVLSGIKEKYTKISNLRLERKTDCFSQQKHWEARTQGT